MITDDEARSELLRLSGLDFFPREVAALKELRLAIQASDTMEIAKRVIDEWLARSPECPKPVDLRLAAHAENDRGKPDATAQEYNAWETLGRMNQTPADRKFLALYLARQQELREDPSLKKFHADSKGRHYRKPTELSEQMRNW